MRSDLESEFGVRFPRFDLALAVLLAREGGDAPPLVTVSPGLKQTFASALEFAPSLVKGTVKFVNLQFRNAVEKSDSLEHWVRHVGGTQAVVELSERLAQDDKIILDELIRRFAQDLAQMPARPHRACRGVLFLDTYEALWTGREGGQAAQARLLDEWVRLLAEYLLGAGVLLVIAGRDRLQWGESDPEWEPCLDQHLLGGVSGHDAQTFLARRGIGSAPPSAPFALQAAILKGCADIVLNTRQSGGRIPIRPCSRACRPPAWPASWRRDSSSRCPAGTWSCGSKR